MTTGTIGTTAAADGLSEQQRTYLRVLAILHYVHGGLIAVIALAMLAFAGFGVLGGRGELGEPGMVPVAALFSCGILFVTAYAAVSFLVGRWLDRRRHWAGVIVFSAINALNAPLGTLLGVFTIVVLISEPVRGAFEGRRTAAAAPPAPAV
ncbi:MAG TPA: hypothetical protein VHM02_08075 [Thermoanaerobaculia bacterium]|nr:hypothetical protein [Thermoanaerobaculia bacterium]